MDKIYEKVGSSQLKRYKLEVAPIWLLEEAVQKELTKNRADTYLEVDEHNVAKTITLLLDHKLHTTKLNQKTKVRA